MEFLTEASWRIYPALTLMAAGAAVAVPGIVRGWSGIMQPLGRPAKVLSIYRGFRRMIIGLALAGMGAAWAWQADWLLALSLIIGAGELFESTIDIWAVTKGKDFKISYPAKR
jgi:hypothetical protein